MKKVDVLVDLQFGSTGKGALAAYLSYENSYDAAISVNMPNAGHTAYSHDGEKFVHKILPSGIFGATSVLMVGPGAVLSLERLKEEAAYVEEYFNSRGKKSPRIIVHELAGIVTKEHADIERNNLNSIASTMQGSSAALIDKISRRRSAVIKHLVEDRDLMPWYMELQLRGNEISYKARILADHIPNVSVVDNAEWLKIIKGCDSILLEGSQGYSLGLNAGFYPYCTSRDCTPARVVSDANIPMAWVRDVYGVCRTYPIRVGNTERGYSGDWYPDQSETSFEEIGVSPETTTVTERVRRVASFSKIQIKEAMQMAMPTKVFLNFCNYCKEEELDLIVQSINEIGEELGCSGVSLMGFGPFQTDINEVQEGIVPMRSGHMDSSIDAMADCSFEWANEVFPKRTPMNACIKLFEEVGELADTINTGEGSISDEISDCMVLITDIAKMYNVDIVRSFYNKMRVNKHVRKWKIINGAIRRLRDGEV